MLKYRKFIKHRTMSIPQVFIIESLDFKDEINNLYEGRILSDILHLNNKKSIYYYIRTKQELKEVVKIFSESNFRYLHLSCHGSIDSMFTTLDQIPFSKLAEILCPYLEKKRLFISACSMTNRNLAKEIIPKSKCYSIVGPNRKIPFSDSAILWAAFYHLMFNISHKSMKRENILNTGQDIVNTFKVGLNYYSRSNNKSRFKFKKLVPTKL